MVTFTSTDGQVTFTAAVAGPQGPVGGVIDGGTTGQVLAKASNTDQDTEWITIVGGGGGGTGDVVGPASATDGRAVLFDGTTGKLIKQASAAPMLVGDAPTAHTHDVLSNIATSTILGRATAGSGDSEELSASSARTVMGLGTAALSATGDFAAASHNHAASAITSGTVDTARLGSGTADSTVFLRGDQTWAAAGGSGAVATDAIWDAKGDLAGGTGANTAARLAVGTNGHVLTADSAEATGMKWAASSGGSADPQSGNLVVGLTVLGGW